MMSLVPIGIDFTPEPTNTISKKPNGPECLVNERIPEPFLSDSGITHFPFEKLTLNA